MISTSWTTKGHVISKGVESYKVTCYFRVIPAQYFQLVASIELGGKFEKSCIRELKKCATLQRFVETTCKFQLRKCAAFILHFAPISCVHCEMRTVSCNEKWGTFQALHSQWQGCAGVRITTCNFTLKPHVRLICLFSDKLEGKNIGYKQRFCIVAWKTR